LRRIIYEGLKIAQALFIDAIFAIICRALAGIFINRITAWTNSPQQPAQSGALRPPPQQG
jgi:hypothetical protein